MYSSILLLDIFNGYQRISVKVWKGTQGGLTANEQLMLDRFFYDSVENRLCLMALIDSQNKIPRA